MRAGSSKSIRIFGKRTIKDRNPDSETNNSGKHVNPAWGEGKTPVEEKVERVLGGDEINLYAHWRMCNG